jgi:hypothetical protein
MNFGYTLHGDDVQRERVVATTTVRGYEMSGGGETVAPGGAVADGRRLPRTPPSTIRSAEIEPPRSFGSYELGEPGR